MKNSPSVGQIGKSISKLFAKHHILLFTLTVVIGVSVAMFLLNGLIATSKESSVQTPAGTSFDKTTIEKIEEFSTSESRQDSFSLPAGRVNPFVE